MNRLDTDAKLVALTFDDGPNAQVQEVLDILDSKGINATFYVIGKEAENNPDVLKSIVDEGNEIGNHSYSHEPFLLKSQDYIRHEIEATGSIIRDAGYNDEITFRPPFGKKLFGLPWFLAQHNIKTITWDVEPDTYFPGDADAITNFTVENVKPGSIILMHPFCEINCAADRQALPEIIDLIKAKGYSFVTVSELLQYK